MVTRGLLNPGKHAVACFQRQTYPNRELVVVVDNPDSALIKHIDTLEDERIRLILLPNERKTLGELRNISLEHARGDYICQWDDDDLYDPTRIETQLSALQTSGASACFLSRWTLWWPAVNKLAISQARLWEGSILGRKAALPKYPPIRRGEDTEMVSILSEREPVISIDAPDLYIYIHHGNNTFNEQHFFQMFHFSKKRWVNEAYEEKLLRLAARLPVHDYLKGIYPRITQSGSLDKTISPGVYPLASIIVRSMGRPELRFALESLAAQDYPNLEIIVVDATGGSHPPLPEIAWKTTHHVRMVGSDRRLKRPHACNVGIDAVRGEWFGFLDDDDTCDPTHVSELIRASESNPQAMVVYGPARLLDDANEVKQVFGFRFNRALMSHGPLFYWQAALIRRKVIELGCRFDERLDVCEDRDFLNQIAEAGEFAFVPIVNFNYRADLGTSGTGQGGNRDIARLMRYDGLLQAKWIGSTTYHSERALRYSTRALNYYAQHNKSSAESLFRDGLKEYPDDPNALCGLGYLLLERGELDAAEPLLKRASEINPTAGLYHLHLATLYEHMGRLSLARQEAVSAAKDVTARDTALRLIQRLGKPTPARLQPPLAAPAKPTNKPPGRMDPCPCGSGLRYKHCCGQLGTGARPLSQTDSLAMKAIDAFRQGRAYASSNMLSKLAPESLSDAANALECGYICHAMADFEQAYSFYYQAATLGKAHEVGEAVSKMCLDWYRNERQESIRRELYKLIRIINDKPAGIRSPTRGAIHVISSLNKVGGTEHRALRLYDVLSPIADVHLWSTTAPLPEFVANYPIKHLNSQLGIHPTSGHFVFIGTYFDYGFWLENASPFRVTICVNTQWTNNLISRIVQLEEIRHHFQLDFTYPSALFRNMVGLDGRVEYHPIDVEKFHSKNIRRFQSAQLMIGRHSRDDPSKFHPNDPDFYRSLIRAGHKIIIMGGTVLAKALAEETAAGNVSLLPESSHEVIDFLAGLDCYIYRTDRNLIETGGTGLLEAMAMALPVVAFVENLGVAELIQHGVNGYLVETEEQARQCIAALASDPRRRQTMGIAARATIVNLMNEQKKSMTEFYLMADLFEPDPASI